MNTLAKIVPTQNPPHGPQKKQWQKPVLDMLALQNAEHGTTHLPDGGLMHRSH